MKKYFRDWNFLVFDNIFQNLIKIRDKIQVVELYLQTYSFLIFLQSLEKDYNDKLIQEKKYLNKSLKFNGYLRMKKITNYFIIWLLTRGERPSIIFPTLTDGSSSSDHNCIYSTATDFFQNKLNASHTFFSQIPVKYHPNMVFILKLPSLE